VEARKTKKNVHKRNSHKDNGHGRGSHSPSCPTPTPQGSMFDVLSFGAKGNGVSDDSEVN